MNPALPARLLPALLALCLVCAGQYGAPHAALAGAAAAGSMPAYVAPSAGVSRHAPTGAAARSLPLPDHPFALAVDTPAHRLVTLNGVGFEDPSSALLAYRLHSLSLLDPVRGSLCTVPLRGYEVSNPLSWYGAGHELAVDPHSGVVYVAVRGTPPTTATSLLAFDGRSGALLQRVPIGADPRGVVVDTRTGRVFVSESGDVRVLDAATGRLLRLVGPGGRIGKSFLGGPMLLDVAHDRVFVANEWGGPALFALSARTGAPLWVTVLTKEDPSDPDGYQGAGSLAYDGHLDRVIVGGSESFTWRMHILDAASGRFLATAARQEFVGANVAVDAVAGHTFVAAEMASVSPDAIQAALVDTRNGRLLHVTRVSPPGSGYKSLGDLVADSGRGYAFVGIGEFAHALVHGLPSYVAVFSTRTGALLRLLPQAGGPDSLALDTGAGRIYVADYTGQSVSVIAEADL